MLSVTPSPVLGIFFHSVGAWFAATCYSPQKYIRAWSWEIFWMTQAAWCWLLWPIIGAMATIPHLGQVLAEAPKQSMVYAFLLGVLYGVGGTAFNISIRYIGFALTYAVAIGVSSLLGTLVPPLVRGGLVEVLSTSGAPWILGGLALGTAGIAVCGTAGRLKEIDLRSRSGGVGEFLLWLGLALAILAGVLSSVYRFSLEAAQPVADVAEKYGAGYWKGNVMYLFSNSGAFVTALAYSMFLALKNRTLGQLRELGPGPQRASLAVNYALAFLTGTLWYGQFFFYNLGNVRLSKDYEFSSWAIHMILLVLFGNLVGLVFKEWKGCRGRTYAAIGLGLLVLCAGFLMIAYGNNLGRPAAP